MFSFHLIRYLVHNGRVFQQVSMNLNMTVVQGIKYSSLSKVTPV